MPPDDPLLVRVSSRRIPRRELRQFLHELSRRIARGRAIVCLITDDRELRRLNREFRGKAYATDVLSFPAMKPEAYIELPPGAESKSGAHSEFQRARFKQGTRGREGASNLGELAISLDRAAAQAAGHGHSLTDELRILMLHGALHLAGYDHETDSGEMARAELRWRKRFGLPIALIERANRGKTRNKRSAA